MRTTFRHYVKSVSHKPWIHAFSTTPRRSDISSPIRSPNTKFVQTLWAETRDPVWGLINAATRAQGFERSSALANYHLSNNDFNKWRPLLYETDIASAVAALRTHGFTTTPPAEPEPETPPPSPLHLPSWVVLYLTAFKVHTSQQALGPQLDLTYAHLEFAPRELQGPLLIFTILNLARFNLLIPLRRVVNTFLTIPLSNPRLEFNLILQALTCNRVRSTESANTVVAILKTMRSRQLTLDSLTYEALLNDRFVTLQLTKHLREQMIQEGVVPSASHLEAYLRVFAKNGVIHDAQQYHEAIHARHASAPDARNGKNNHTRANTILLAAQDDHMSAFGFLHKLNQPKSFEDGDSHRQLQPRLSSPESLYPTSTVSTSDLTAALSVAARDMSVTGDRLMGMFEHMQAKTHLFQPTVVTYTVLIHGLLSRHDGRAVDVWNTLKETGLEIDKPALVLGLRALTLAFKPEEAFVELENLAAPDDHLPPGIYRLRRPIRLTSHDVNEFMVALNRIGRPDVVFKLWDHMGELYGVVPDSNTLSLLLHAARTAGKLDDSFSGAMAQLALKNPFRTLPPKPTSRDAIVASIKEIVGYRGRGGIRYVSGFWNGHPPMEVARKIFLQAIFGMAPAQLLNVASPAHPIRTSADDDAMQGMGLPRLGPKKDLFVPPPGLLTSKGETHYPSIVVTSDTCMKYLFLLQFMSRASEIPLLLAWMRYLNISPSTSMVAFALVLWSEISVQAPLIEAWAGGSEKNQYTRLEAWLVEWRGRLPGEDRMHHCRQTLARMRQRR